MTSYLPATPSVPRAGLVLLDPADSTVLTIIPLQYNPDSITRTLQPLGTGADQGDRSEALRLRGPAQETFKLEAELDATDQLAETTADGFAEVAENGLLPLLCALEQLVNPSVTELMAQDSVAQLGAFEVTPVQAPLTVLVWGSRVVPVRVTDFSITEEAFDSRLNPLRARVSLSLRVLTVDDVGFQHQGGQLFLGYQAHRETLSTLRPPADLSSVGLLRPPGGQG